MGTWDLRLISSSFQQDGDESVIELFGRARTGESVTVLVPGFKPYFFIVDPAPSLEGLLPKEEGIESATPDRLLYKAEMHDVLRVTFWTRARWRNGGTAYARPTGSSPGTSPITTASSTTRTWAHA